MHGSDRKVIRVLLRLTRIGDFEQGTRHEYHGSRTGDVAPQKPDQKRYPAALNHHAGVVAVADVPHFMGDDQVRQRSGPFATDR
jgi:hypothetical protein